MMIASAPQESRNDNVFGMMAKAMDSTSVASSWTVSDDDNGLEELGDADNEPASPPRSPPGSYDIRGDNADTQSVQSGITFMSTASMKQNPLEMVLFMNKFGDSTTRPALEEASQENSSHHGEEPEQEQQEADAANVSIVSRDLPSGISLNESMYVDDREEEHQAKADQANQAGMDAETAACIKALGWDETEVPSAVRLVNHDMALQYTGAVGQGSRCVRALNALPKPSYKVSKKTTKTPVPGKKRGLFRKQVYDVKVTEEINFKPLTDAPFVLPNGAQCTMPRLASYFEVDIVAGPKEGLTVPKAETPSPEEQEAEQQDEQLLFKDEQEQQPEQASPKDAAAAEDEEVHPPCVVIGLSLSKFHWNSNMPGWDSKSYGFHSDDGSTYFNGRQKKSYGPTFGEGDVVGCGVDYETRQMFYTVNGKFMGFAYKMTQAQLLQGKWIPTVGLDSHLAVHYNDGTERPFCFDFKSFIKKGAPRQAQV